MLKCGIRLLSKSKAACHTGTNIFFNQSMKTKVLFLYCGPRDIITGGVKYDNSIREILSADPRFEVDIITLDNIKTAGFARTFSRLTSGISNLRMLNKCRKYDWVISNSVYGLYLIPLAWMLRFTSTRFIIIHHHFEYHTLGKCLRKTVTRILENIFLRISRPPVVVSPYVLDLCHKYFPRKDFFYWQIPFEVPDSTVAPDPVPGNLLYIGNIDPRKGLVHLIESMVILKKRGVNVAATVIGKRIDEAYCRNIDEIIARENLNVIFTGFISDEEKDRLTAQADIFAFPSLYEGYGMVICESMRRGLPAVVFDNSAMPYTVTDNVNGLVVPTGDNKAYADAIERIVTDRQLRSRLSAGALATHFVSPDEHRARVTADLLTKEAR